MVERLRERLVAFADESGRELFDLPDAPRPDARVAAPVRLLGEYDNVLLGQADRSRIILPDFPWDAMLSHGRFVNNLLVDGMLRATCWIERDEVEAEARAMAAFAGAGDVAFEPPVGRRPG